MRDFSIRTARLSDAEALSDIYRWYVENTAVSYEYIAPNADEFARRIAATLEKYPYIVAEDESGMQDLSIPAKPQTGPQRSPSTWSVPEEAAALAKPCTHGLKRY